MSNPLIFSGATRNRHFDLSGCISYRYIFKKEVISRYCSTKFLHCFAAKFFTTHFLLQIYEESS
jgi:hypothetical protein